MAEEMGRVTLQKFMRHTIQWGLLEIERLRLEACDIENDEGLTKRKREEILQKYYLEIIHVFRLVYPARKYALEAYPQYHETLYWMCSIITTLEQEGDLPPGGCECTDCLENIPAEEA